MVPLIIGICAVSMSALCLVKKMYDNCYDNVNTIEKNESYLSDDNWVMVKIDSVAHKK